jgi:hypothetical protein
MRDRHDRFSNVIVLLFVFAMVMAVAPVSAVTAGADGSVAGTTADGTIVGSVTNEDGDGLPAATVELIDADTDVVVDTTTTTDGGSYGFENVAPGEYRVEAEYLTETGFATVDLGDGQTAFTNVVIIGVSPDAKPEAVIDATAPDTITPGENTTVTFTIGNDGSATAESGGLQISLSGPASVVAVSGNGTNSPDRFFLTPLQPGDTWTVEYIIRAATNATEPVTVTGTAFVGRESNATTNVSITPVQASDTLADHYRRDDGDVTIDEVLDAIDAFNSDNRQVSGYGPVDIRDVLGLIEAFNE